MSRRSEWEVVCDELHTIEEINPDNSLSKAKYDGVTFEVWEEFTGRVRRGQTTPKDEFLGYSRTNEPQHVRTFLFEEAPKCLECGKALDHDGPKEVIKVNGGYICKTCLTVEAKCAETGCEVFQYKFGPKHLSTELSGPHANKLVCRTHEIEGPSYRKEPNAWRNSAPKTP
ncbi:MAG TPA: hypothetical protein VEA59_05335 [Patescibacteria group bacterium]|nr:hypothetical protein [Patescibacteria group bacterium]